MKVDIIHVPGTAADFQVCPRQNRIFNTSAQWVALEEEEY